MLQSIFYGNGINRLTRGMPSWDQLIKELFDVELDKNIPNPLKYEALLVKKPYKKQDLVINNGRRIVSHGKGRIAA